MNITSAFVWIGLALSIGAGFTVAAVALGFATDFIYRRLLLVHDLAVILKFLRRAKRRGLIKTKRNNGH